MVIIKAAAPATSAGSRRYEVQMLPIEARAHAMRTIREGHRCRYGARQQRIRANGTNEWSWYEDVEV